MIPVIYWYFRNFIYTENPVYPFLNEIFKGLNYSQEHSRALSIAVRSGSISFEKITSFLSRVPGDYLIIFESFLFLNLIIFSILGLFRREQNIKYLSLFGLISTSLIILTVGFPSVRYSLPIIPILSLTTSFILFNFFKRVNWYKVPLVMLLIISILIEAGFTLNEQYMFYRNNFKRGLDSALSKEKARQYLNLQDNYLGIDYANKNLGKDQDKILVLFDNRLYYFNMEAIYADPSVTGLFTNPQTKTSIDVYQKVKEMGITYVFVNNNWGTSPNLRKDLYDPFTENYLEPVFQESKVSLYKLK